MRDLGLMQKKNRKKGIILSKILESLTVSIEHPCGMIHFVNQTLGLKASIFLYNTQHSTKKIDFQKYSRAF